MIGAITGDIIGSVHEFMGTKTREFPLFGEGTRFTDDSVLTIAVADCLLTGSPYVDRFHAYTKAYPDRIYGARFQGWVESGSREPYNSWGNGSAMRVSPVGHAFDDIDSVLSEAQKCAEVTHNHPEGIKGAQAVALSVFMARKGSSKSEIRREIVSRFGYNLDRTIDEIRPDYVFNESCQGTVPEALLAFLESVDYESAIRNAISLGGDADTLACISGSIAGAFFGVPPEVSDRALDHLDPSLRSVVDRFCVLHGIGSA